MDFDDALDSDAESKHHREWFERKVAELKAELDRLPVDRQEQLRGELDDEPGKAEA